MFLPVNSDEPYAGRFRLIAFGERAISMRIRLIYVRLISGVFPLSKVLHSEFLQGTLILPLMEAFQPEAHYLSSNGSNAFDPCLNRVYRRENF